MATAHISTGAEVFGRLIGIRGKKRTNPKRG